MGGRATRSIKTVNALYVCARACVRARTRNVLLAVSVLQVEMRVEVDKNLLARLGCRDHPGALLRRWVGARVARGGQVAR